jgi:hypothetical protein
MSSGIEAHTSNIPMRLFKFNSINWDNQSVRKWEILEVVQCWSHKGLILFNLTRRQKSTLILCSYINHIRVSQEMNNYDSKIDGIKFPKCNYSKLQVTMLLSSVSDKTVSIKAVFFYVTSIFIQTFRTLHCHSYAVSILHIQMVPVLKVLIELFLHNSIRIHFAEIASLFHTNHTSLLS